MFPLGLLVAVASITAEGEPLSDRPPCSLADMRVVAVSLEIMDPRESRYHLAFETDFLADTNLMRRRYAELCDAPPLRDSIRFPGRDVCNEMAYSNRRYHDRLLDIQWMHAEWIKDAICDTDRLYEVWDTVRDAQCHYYYVTVRRAALQRLREKLGAEAYYAGALPPSVPVWFMQKGD